MTIKSFAVILLLVCFFGYIREQKEKEKYLTEVPPVQSEVKVAQILSVTSGYRSYNNTQILGDDGQEYFVSRGTYQIGDTLNCTFYPNAPSESYCDGEVVKEPKAKAEPTSEVKMDTSSVSIQPDGSVIWEKRGGEYDEGGKIKPSEPEL